MKRFDHPAQRANPYPAPGTQIADFRYDSALVLLRLKDAVPMRTGEDADYLTGAAFICAWQPKGGDWQQITVPEGLITDLTSVPRLMRWVIGRVGPWLEAAILHDYLYIAWQDVEDKAPTAADRRFADDLMLAAMRAAQVGWLARTSIYLTIRLFGRGTYDGRNAERYVDLCDPTIASQIVNSHPAPKG